MTQVEVAVGDTVVIPSVPDWCLGSPYGRVVLCPHCMAGTTLVSASPTGPYVFDREDAPGSYRAFADLASHLQTCAPAFRGNGIHRVDSDRQMRVAAELSDWSRREAGWDAPLYSDHLIMTDGAAYVFVRNGQPQGYALFRTLTFDSGRGERTVIEDLYTFPGFRRQRVARRLLEHAMRQHVFNLDFLPVSYPVRPEAARLVGSVARANGSQIMCVSRQGWWDATVDDFLRETGADDHA